MTETLMILKALKDVQRLLVLKIVNSSNQMETVVHNNTVLMISTENLNLLVMVKAGVNVFLVI
jgi:hypothetical protein